MRWLRSLAVASLAYSSVASAQPARIGHYPSWKPGIQYFATSNNPTPAFKWGTGSAYNAGVATQATFTQSSAPAVGDTLFVVLNGIDSSGMATHFTGSQCAAMTPTFTLVTYAAPTSASSASLLVCYRKADGTEPSSFTSGAAWSTPFTLGLTAAYIDFSNGSSMDASTTYVPFAGVTAIASGQITASAGNVLTTFLGNAFASNQGVTVSPNSGSWTYYYDPPSATGCTVCGIIGLQAITLVSSGTTAVQNFTSSRSGGDYGNTISAAIIP